MEDEAIGMEKGYVREECPLGGQEGLRMEEGSRRGRDGSEWRKSSELRKGTVEDRRKG